MRAGFRSDLAAFELFRLFMPYTLRAVHHADA
jgi:hypothetical protein